MTKACVLQRHVTKKKASHFSVQALHKSRGQQSWLALGLCLLDILLLSCRTLFCSTTLLEKNIGNEEERKSKERWNSSFLPIFLPKVLCYSSMSYEKCQLAHETVIVQYISSSASCSVCTLCRPWRADFRISMRRKLVWSAPNSNAGKQLCNKTGQLIGYRCAESQWPKPCPNDGGLVRETMVHERRTRKHAPWTCPCM